MAYNQVTITGYNANPPEDDGTQATSNEVSWSKHKTKLGDPLKTAIEAIDSNVASAFTAVEGNTPAGVIMAYGGSTSPSGFLLCDGSAVSRTTYADLFTVIGTTYGAGNGSTTFNVPDLTGRVPAGKEASATRLTSGGSGVDGGTLGASGGSETHQLIIAELPTIDIDNYLNDPGHTHSQSYRGTSNTENGVNSTMASTSNLGATTGSSTTGINFDPFGSDTAHNNTQPTLIVNYIIKT